MIPIEQNFAKNTLFFMDFRVFYQAECKTQIGIEVDGCCEVLEIDLENILQFCQTIKSTTYIVQ